MYVLLQINLNINDLMHPHTLNQHGEGTMDPLSLSSLGLLTAVDTPTHTRDPNCDVILRLTTAGGYDKLRKTIDAKKWH
jgi:hypothetical protein